MKTDFETLKALSSYTVNHLKQAEIIEFAADLALLLMKTLKNRQLKKLKKNSAKIFLATLQKQKCLTMLARKSLSHSMAKTLVDFI